MTAKGTGSFLETVNQPPAACRQATVAVIIPTKNRPELLPEAISSALAQTHPPHEIIVVDDGSTPPVNGVKLKERYGPTIRVLRNDQSWGLAYSRNRGVEKATAEYIIHLDDDDLLGKEAIEECIAVLQNFPQVDLVMFSVKGFGPNSEYFNRVQPEGVEHIIQQGKGIEVQPDIILFGRDLFPALLQRVPTAFQRVMSRKGIWQAVSQLRWDVYCMDAYIPDVHTAQISINGTLRDSEWARYASVVCCRIALINRPLYRARCAGQGYSSQPANQQLHIHQSIEILKHLSHGAKMVPKLMRWKSEIRTALAQAYFDAAYQHHKSGDQLNAWKFLKQAVLKGIRPKHFKLAVRMWMASYGAVCRSISKLK